MSTSCAEVYTLDNVIRAIERAEGLQARRKAEILSAIRTLTAAANRAPKEVLAHPPEVNRLIEETSWKATGLAPGSVSNKISLLRTGMRIAGINIDRHRRKLDVDADWVSVLATIPERYRHAVTPFANWASSVGLGIDAVDPAAFNRYWTYLDQCTLQKNKRSRWLDARRAWNAWLRHARPGCPEVPLDRPLRPRSHPWSRFPCELHDDAMAWRGWAGQVDFDETKRRPLKKITLDGYVYAFQRTATLLVDDGIDPETLVRLEAFFVSGRPRRLRQLVQGEKSVEEARDRLRAIFCALLAAARWFEVVRPEVLTEDCRAGIAYAKTVVDKLGRRRKMADLNKTKLAKLREPRIGFLFRNLAASVVSRHPPTEPLSAAGALELRHASLHSLLQEARSGSAALSPSISIGTSYAPWPAATALG